MIRKALLFTSLLLIHILSIAQETTPSRVDMADTLRSNGKIYVVVAVLLTIFAGIVIYLVRLDRKITKLEKADKISI